jgi:hypothetical protein
MVTFARPRVRQVSFLLAAIMLACPPIASATRIDIDDPTLLGPVVHRQRIPHGHTFLDRAIAEVRVEDGIYSYIYAITSSPILPPTACCESRMLNYGISGHPLEDTWGAINSSDIYWGGTPGSPGLVGHTRAVASITSIDDGLLVVPTRGGPGGPFVVVYVQSTFRPSLDGRFSYTGQVVDDDGVLRTETYHRDGVLVPVPEPGSIVLFGLGLASLAAKRRMSRSRRVARPGSYD